MKLDNHECVLNRRDIKTRKYWLLAAIVQYVGIPLFYLGAFFLRSQANGMAQNLFVMHISSLCVGMILFYLLYRCAYKKPGTALLTSVLVISPLIKFKQFTDQAAIFGIEFGIFNMLDSIPFFIIYLWFYVLSFQLRTLNKMNEPVALSEEIKCAVEEMREAKDIDTLKLKLHFSMKNWPQHESALFKEYKIRERILEDESPCL